MTFKELCNKLNSLKITKVCAHLYLKEGQPVTYYNIKYNIIKNNYQRLTYLDISEYNYNLAIEYVNKNAANELFFSIKEIQDIAAFFNWIDYINRFKNYITDLCSKYNSTLNTTN